MCIMYSSCFNFKLMDLYSLLRERPYLPVIHLTTTTTEATLKFLCTPHHYPIITQSISHLPSLIKYYRGPKTSPSSPVGQSVVKGGAVDRLTNTQKYTGSHKQRFDADGRGMGAAGRKEVADKSGYVSGYKNKNSYDKTH